MTIQWKLPHMEMPQDPPSRAWLLAELERVEAEFGNAIAMHRAAWAKARERRDEIEVEQSGQHPGVVAAVAETDKRYERRIADVKFWMAERACLAASVTAIKAMIDARPRPPVYRGSDQQVPRPRDWEPRNRQG